MVGLCLKCQSENHTGRDCDMALRFRKGTCCYNCGLPQRLYQEFIHGDIESGSIIIRWSFDP
jgi:hypothetical protein